MANFIEEVFQVYIHYVNIALIDVLLRLLHGLLGIAVRSEAVTVFFELRLKP